MFGLCQKENMITTPFGELIDGDYEIAEDLRTEFMDKARDSNKKDYEDARDLYANPWRYYKNEFETKRRRTEEENERAKKTGRSALDARRQAEFNRRHRESGFDSDDPNRERVRFVREQYPNRDGNMSD